MTTSDIAFLEVFGEARIAVPPAVAEFNLKGVSKSTIERRVPELVKDGLLRKADENRGHYRITEKGEAYLAGEPVADDLEK